MKNQEDKWTPTKWTCCTDAELIDSAGADEVTIERIVSPFYNGERFAVRHIGSVLSVNGKWEYEPFPSSRDDAFYERCRFATFEAAKRAAEAAIKKARP